MAFALFNLYWSRGSQLVASAQTDSFGRPTALRHALTLICPTMLSRLSPRSYRHDRVFVCACTHYLVFKEPTAEAPAAPRPSKAQALRSSNSSFGELTEFTICRVACQALFASISNFFRSQATPKGSPESLVWKRRRFNLAVFPGNCKLATSRMSLPIHQRCCDQLSVSAPKSASLGELDEITIGSFACQHHSAFL